MTKQSATESAPRPTLVITYTDDRLGLIITLQFTADSTKT